MGKLMRPRGSVLDCGASPCPPRSKLTGSMRTSAEPETKRVRQHDRATGPDRQSVRLRYIDRFLTEIARGSEEVEQALGQHLHWGFHENPSARIDDPSAFADAARAMNARIIELAQVGERGVILDAGSGFGGMVHQLAEQLPSATVTGLNHDIRQIEQARTQSDGSISDNHRFLCADALRLPFADQSFDVIIASELLCHLDDDAGFFSEAGRALKPGGRLIIADHVVAGAAQPVAQCVDFLFGPLFTRLYARLNCTRTMTDFTRLAKQAGLDVETTDDLTKNTLPNYRFLRRLMRRFDISLTEKRLNDLISLAMENAARLGAFRYALMKFRLKN